MMEATEGSGTWCTQKETTSSWIQILAALPYLKVKLNIRAVSAVYTLLPFFSPAFHSKMLHDDWIYYLGFLFHMMDIPLVEKGSKVSAIGLGHKPTRDQ